MPTYEYRCKACKHEFEEMQPISADPLVICPKCAKPALKRVMGGGGGMIFKGTGFYLTDYKRNAASPSPPKKSDKKSGPSDSKSSSSTSGSHSD